MGGRLQHFSQFRTLMGLMHRFAAVSCLFFALLFFRILQATLAAWLRRVVSLDGDDPTFGLASG